MTEELVLVTGFRGRIAQDIARTLFEKGFSLGLHRGIGAVRLAEWRAFAQSRRIFRLPTNVAIQPGVEARSRAANFALPLVTSLVHLELNAIANSGIALSADLLRQFRTSLPPGRRIAVVTVTALSDAISMPARMQRMASVKAMALDLAPLVRFNAVEIFGVASDSSAIDERLAADAARAVHFALEMPAMTGQTIVLAPDGSRMRHPVL